MLLGGADVVYDTVSSPQTFEVGVRIANIRGSVVALGVEPPRRFEWTPLYFKELSVVGSNGFGIEGYDGRRQHAMEWYFEFLRMRQIDLTPIITHRFPLADYRDAFMTCYAQGGARSGQGAVRPLQRRRRGGSAMSRLLMGIDLGEGGVRCVGCSIWRRARAASVLRCSHSPRAAAVRPTSTPTSCGAHGPPRAAARAGAAAEDVAGVSVTAMRFATVLLDAAERCRGAEPRRALGGREPPMAPSAATPCRRDRMWPLPIHAVRAARPAAQRAPEVSSAPPRCSLSDWLNFRFCGRRVTDATAGWLYRRILICGGEGAPYLIDAFGLPRAIFPEARPSGERIGDSG